MQALLKMLKDLEQVETGLAELYEGLSEIFHADLAAYNLFMHLKLDEISHRNILQYEGRVLAANPEAAKAISVETGRMDRTLEDLRRFRERFPSPSLDDALCERLHLEKCTAELYYHEAFERPYPEFARFLATLHSGSLAHYEKLWKFAAVRGIGGPPLSRAAVYERP